MAVKYDLMVANGSYTQAGEKKTSWIKIGRVMQKDNGKFVMKLDSIPTSCTNLDGQQVAWDGWVQMFEPRPREDQDSQPQGVSQGQVVPNEFDDDIPF